MSDLIQSDSDDLRDLLRALADPERAALYIDDRELRRRIAPHLGWERFTAAIRELERRGFPTVNALWRGRYWPAVSAWLDSDEGMGTNAPDAIAQDGPEDFNATPREKTRIQARAQRPALLDSETGGSRADGLSGSLYRLAARGKR